MSLRLDRKEHVALSTCFLAYKRRGRGGLNPSNHNTTDAHRTYGFILMEAQTYLNARVFVFHYPPYPWAPLLSNLVVNHDSTNCVASLSRSFLSSLSLEGCPASLDGTTRPLQLVTSSQTPSTLELGMQRKKCMGKEDGSGRCATFFHCAHKKRFRFADRYHICTNLLFWNSLISCKLQKSNDKEDYKTPCNKRHGYWQPCWCVVMEEIRTDANNGFPTS
jgi:hypothetical protein